MDDETRNSVGDATQSKKSVAFFGARARALKLSPAANRKITLASYQTIQHTRELLYCTVTFRTD